VYAASFEEPASSAGHETGSHGSDDGHNRAGGEAAGETGGSMMSHTGYLYLVDDSGAVVVEWPAGTTAGQYAADLERILPAGTTTDDEG
jgi:hypothetical protein